MELDQLKSIWQQYDSKLQKALKLNVRFLEMIEARKIKSKLTPLLWQKGFETVLHAAAILLLLLFLAKNTNDYHYSLSAGLLLAFYGVAIFNSFMQVKIINRIDYTNEIVSIQKDLATLQARTLGYAKLTILCIPTFLAYPLVISKAIKDFNLTFFKDFDIITQSNGAWWTAQMASSLALIPVCIWLYIKLSRKHIDEPWVRNFISRSSGKSVTKSLEFLNELDTLKREAAKERTLFSQ